MTAWLLTTPVQTTFNPSVVFKAKRPWTGKQERWHAGLDLQAKEGALILAPEPCIVVDTDRGWDGTAKATLVHTLSGHTLLLGCTALGSAPPPGTAVPTGGILARVGFYTKTDKTHSSMLHLQVYKGLLTPAQANARQSWPVAAPQPAGLLDPQVYLAGAELLPQEQLPDESPPGPQVSAGDGRSGGQPCLKVNGVMTCTLPDVGAWVAALKSYRAAAEPLLKHANALVIDAKLLTWTTAASNAIDTLGEADLLLNDHANNDVDGLPDAKVAALVDLCVAVREAIEVLTAFVGQKPAPAPKPKPAPKPDPAPKPGPAKPKKKASGGAAVVAVLGVLVVGGGAAYAYSR